MRIEASKDVNNVRLEIGPGYRCVESHKKQQRSSLNNKKKNIQKPHNNYKAGVTQSVCLGQAMSIEKLEKDENL